MSVSPSPIPHELRWHVRRHNLRVLFLGVICVLAAFWVWGALYLAVTWIGWLALTTLHGINAPQNPNFVVPFLIAVMVLLVVTWIVRCLFDRRPPQLGSFRWSKVLFDLLLLPGSLTFAGPATFRAWVGVSESALQAAWQLLQQLHADGKLSLQELRTVVPDSKKLESAMYLLGITGLTETDQYGGIWYLHLRNDTTRAMVRRLIQLGR